MRTRASATLLIGTFVALVSTAVVCPPVGHCAVTVKAQLNAGTFNGLDPNDAAWKKVTEYSVTLDTVITAAGVPQPLPSSKFKILKVKALHNGADIFFRLAWADKTKDTSVGDPPLFADAVALEIPYSAASSSIAMGNQLQPVNILFWRGNLGDPATGLGQPQNIVSGGAGTVQTSPDSPGLPTACSQRYAAGTWTVVIRRPLSGASSTNGNLVALAPATNYRITFAQWDGGNAERDAVKLVAGSWQTLYINAR